jgi:hypothetical protein
MFFFILMWLLNFGISAWNAYAVGTAWVEARVVGGWPRVMCWCGAVMSATGFSWCYLILLVLGAYQYQYINLEQRDIALSLGYIVLIPGMLMSGLVITVDSWARAFRRGGFLNYGIAAYNTYAQIHNTWSAINTFPAAFGRVRGYFSDRDNRDNKSGLVVVILLVAVALAAGVLTTTLIIWLTAGSRPLPPPPSREQFEDSARNVESQRRPWR